MMRYGRFGILVFVLLLGMVSLRSEGVQVVKSKTHGTGHQKLGTAIISDLQGNVKNAGDHYNISGTNVWVRMYAKNSWPNRLHSCAVLLGDTVVAAGNSVKVSPAAGGTGPDCLVTDGAGNWQSEANRGYVKFDSTATQQTGLQGDLSLYLFPMGGTAFPTKQPIPAVRLYNKAYVLANPNVRYAAEMGDYVHNKCVQMNHSATDNTTGDDTVVAMNVPSYTVFYIGSHGNYQESTEETYFWAPSDGANDTVTSGRVAGAVAQKGVAPSYNFVQLDCCYSAGWEDIIHQQTVLHKDMAIGFGILDANGGVQANRAYIGWIGLDWNFASNRAWTEEVWNQLAVGSTVGHAYSEANRLYNEVGTAYVYGDRSTTVHAVYCGVVDPAP